MSTDTAEEDSRAPVQYISSWLFPSHIFLVPRTIVTYNVIRKSFRVRGNVEKQKKKKRIPIVFDGDETWKTARFSKLRERLESSNVYFTIVFAAS